MRTSSADARNIPRPGGEESPDPPRPDQPPADGPLTLRQIDASRGYLIHPRAVEELPGIKWMAFRQNDAGRDTTIPRPDEIHPVHDTTQGNVDRAHWVRPVADVPEAERADCFWIADRELARAWLDLHNVKGVRAPIAD